MQSIYYVSQLVGSSLMSTLTVNRPIMWVRKIIFLVNCKKTKGISKIIKKNFRSRELRKSSKQHTVYASRYVLPQEADYMGKLTVIVEIRNIFSYLTQEPIGKHSKQVFQTIMVKNISRYIQTVQYQRPLFCARWELSTK